MNPRLLPMVAALSIGLTFFAEPADGGVIMGLPDITVGGAFRYNPATDQLLVSGSASQFVDASGKASPIYRGSAKGLAKYSSGRFSMTAEVDQHGTLSTGEFSITGAYDHLTPNSVGGPADIRVTLLRGTFTEAKLIMGTGPLQVDFFAELDNTSALAHLYGPVAVVRFGSFGNLDSFAVDSLVEDFASADIGRPVPEPASLVAWSCMTLLGCGFQYRRRRQVAAHARLDS